MHFENSNQGRKKEKTYETILSEKFKKFPLFVRITLILFIIGLFGEIFRIPFLKPLFTLSLSLLFFLVIIKFIKIIRRLLKKEQVIDSWNILIQNAQGKSEEIFGEIEQLIEKTKAPDIEMKKEFVIPGIIRGIFGDKREFLIVRNHRNLDLKTFQMYVNARDYGENLHISWYLITRLGFFEFLFALIFRSFNPELLLAKLDLFDQQDLNAYVTNTHHCILEVVEKLVLSLGQDPAKIERKSRGFLGIS